MFSLMKSFFTTSSSSSSASKESSKSRSTNQSKRSKSPSISTSSSSSSSSSSALSLFAGSSSCSTTSVRTAPTTFVSTEPILPIQRHSNHLPREFYITPERVLQGVIYPKYRQDYQYDHPLAKYNPARPYIGYFSNHQINCIIIGWAYTWNQHFETGVLRTYCSVEGPLFKEPRPVHSAFRKPCGKFRKDLRSPRGQILEAEERVRKGEKALRKAELSLQKAKEALSRAEEAVRETEQDLCEIRRTFDRKMEKPMLKYSAAWATYDWAVSQTLLSEQDLQEGREELEEFTKQPGRKAGFIRITRLHGVSGRRAFGYRRFR